MRSRSYLDPPLAQSDAGVSQRGVIPETQQWNIRTNWFRDRLVDPMEVWQFPLTEVWLEASQEWTSRRSSPPCSGCPPERQKHSSVTYKPAAGREELPKPAEKPSDSLKTLKSTIKTSEVLIHLLTETQPQKLFRHWPADRSWKLTGPDIIRCFSLEQFWLWMENADFNLILWLRVFVTSLSVSLSLKKWLQQFSVVFANLLIILEREKCNVKCKKCVWM